MSKARQPTMAEQFVMSVYNRNEDPASGSDEGPLMHSKEILEELQDDWDGSVFSIRNTGDRVHMIYVFPDFSRLRVLRIRASPAGFGAFNSFNILPF